MELEKNKTKRIAKNTIVLYVRSVIVLLLTLYTSRVFLKSLGVEDYGLYNVIGGVVALFSFLKTSLTKSTQRFLNVEMAKPLGRLTDTFQVSMTIHLGIAIIAIILAETIGLWFLNTYINVPIGREYAANMVFQSTIVSLALTIIMVPYSATIIAHEKMTFFAVVSIIDAVLKLIIAFLISYGDWDRLIFYGWLLMAIHLVNLLMYVVYCNNKFSEASFKIKYDRDIFKGIFSYTTWTIAGQAAILGTNQGNNILINMFHSVTANAAMGVAHQVNGAIVTLTSNFQTAFNPQITKSYASGDYDYLRKLVYTTSKISYFLLMIVSLPVMFNIDFLLGIWLEDVPLYSASFCILMLWNSILNALGAPLNFTVLSSGKIKWFQIFTSLAFLADLIILYPLFLMGFPAITAMVVKVSTMILVLYVRLYFAHKEIECIDMISYFKEVIFPLTASTLISVIPAGALFYYADSPLQTLGSTLFLVLLSFISVYYIGLTKAQRTSLVNVLSKFKKKNRKS